MLHHKQAAQTGAGRASIRCRCPEQAAKAPLLRQRRAASASASAAAAAAPPPPIANEPEVLSKEQVVAFYRDGFLAVPGFASPEEVAALRARANELVSAFEPSTVASVFSTRGDNQTQARDPYFLESASKVSFFFEERAFGAAGGLAVPKDLAINKIGHAMHDLDPVFRAYSRSPRMAAALRAIGFASPAPVQSMYIFKQPRIGGEVVPHQDSTFLWTDPPSCVGAWLALEDADKSNGCLWGLKASHNAGVARRFVRAPAAEGSGGGGGQSLVFTAPAPEYDLAAFDPLEVTAGTLVLLHGANVHYSAENASNVSRHSYTLHFVEAGREWPADNWAQRPKDMPWEPLY